MSGLDCLYKTLKKNLMGNLKTSFHRLEFNISYIVKRLKENDLGNMSGGKVYEVKLDNGEILVVKKVEKKLQALQDKEFKIEGTLCISSGDSKLLVYEYMPNGSLWECLHGCQGETLDWPTCYKIAFHVT
eukprot:Gb_01589 [translate_table: standard]